MLTLMAAFAESESEQKTSGRYKLVVQEGQAPRMGIIGNTLIESPRTPFSANTLPWTPFGATQTLKKPLLSKALHPAAEVLDHVEEIPVVEGIEAAQARCYGWPQYFRFCG